MIKLSILYPHNEGSHFDFDYYLEKHMPMVMAKLSSALREVSVEKGVSSGFPGSKPPFMATCHLSFDSSSAFYSAFAPHMKSFQDDIVQFTNVQPVILMSDVKINQK